MTLGKTIKQMREGLGLSQDELASHLNIEANLIDAWEIDTAQPSHEHLQIMADLFNIRIKDLTPVRKSARRRLPLHSSKGY